MALADKYTFTFSSVLDGEEHTFTIQQDGYAGAVETLEFLPGRDFMILQYDTSNPVFLHPVRGSQLTLKLVLTPEQIEEFTLAETRTWFVIWTSNQGWEWRGWLQPQISTNYNPYDLGVIELQFTDNLGALQNTPDNVMNSAFVELQPFEEMIERELSLTDISLPVSISTSVRHADYPGEKVHETAHLEQAMTLDYNGQDAQSAYSILAKMLRMMHCVVFQNNGEWVIFNPIDREASSYGIDLLQQYDIVARSLNVRFEAPLSKTTGISYHYQIRHTQENRDFKTYIPTGPAKGFTFWQQVGLLGNEIFGINTVSGKNYFVVRGNFFAGNADSTDYYVNDGGSVTRGEPIRVYLNYEITFNDVVNPRVSITNDVAGTIYYLTVNRDWTTTLTILTGEDTIKEILNTDIPANDDGTIQIRIYRPEVPSAGAYNPTQSYMRFAYAEILAAKSSEPTDLKLFRSIGKKDNRGLREDEKFETIGLQFDTEFSPNEAAFWQYDKYISFIFASDGTRLDSKFISDYNSEEKPLTEFAVNTYMRCFAKPQLYIEAQLYGKALRIGEIYTASIPGLPDNLSFMVTAYSWDVQNDIYNAILSYVSYDNNDTIEMQRFWLQQSQEEPNE